jgi:hypothetical protein
VAISIGGKMNMFNLIKQQSNPFSTGGGGPNFETRVQAVFVIQMLIGRSYLCLPPWPIVKLKLQGRYAGFNTDDFIVFVKCPQTNREAKLLAQIKHSISFTVGNDFFKEVIQAAWNDFNNPSIFTERDAFALITGPLSASDSEIRHILEWARQCEDEKEFLDKINLPKFNSDARRNKVKVFRTHLKTANGEKDISDKQLWLFMKSFHIIGYDLDTETSSSVSLIQSLIEQKSEENAIHLWSRIVNVVQSFNQNAGTLNLSNIPDDIREAFSKKENNLLSSSKYYDKALESQSVSEEKVFKVTPKPIRNGFEEYLISREKVRLRASLPKFPRLSGHCVIDFASPKLKDCIFQFDQKEIMEILFKGLHTNYQLGLRGFLPIYSPKVEKQLVLFGKCTIFITEAEVDQLCQIIDEFSSDLLNEIEAIEKAMGSVQFMPSLQYPKDGYKLVRIDRNLWRRLLDFANSNSNGDGDPRWQIFDWCDGLLKIFTKASNQSMDQGFHAIIYPEEAECFYTNHRVANDSIWLVWRPMSSNYDFDVFEDFSYRKKWNAAITYCWLMEEFLPKVIQYYKLGKGVYDIYVNSDWSVDFDSIKTLDDLKASVSILQRFYNSTTDIDFFTATDQQLLYAAVSNSLNIASFKDVSYICGNMGIPFGSDIDQIIDHLRSSKKVKKDSVVGSFAIDCALRTILYACDNVKVKMDEHTVRKIADCLKPYYQRYRQCKLLEKYSNR